MSPSNDTSGMPDTSIAARCAGIVTYNPDLGRLRANLEAIVPQVREVFVCDNGSGNPEELRALLASFPTVTLEELGENLGIAAALNRLLGAAHAGGFGWIVLLDQDSVASDGMADALAAHADATTGLVCPFILDRNRMSVEEWRTMDMPAVQRLEHAAKHGAITSGSLVQVAAALAVGGFDERYFIDYVDFDFNERLLLAGYAIVRVNDTYLLHEKGKSEATWLRVPRATAAGRQWQPLYKLGYSPQRCYYQARNRVIYWKRYRRHVGSEGLTEIPMLMGLSLLVEDRKMAKLGAYLRGIRDGVRARVKPAPERRQEERA